MRNINYYRKGNFYYTKCKNCGKEFRVTKKQMKAGKKYCSAKCKTQMNNRVNYIRNNKYMKKLRDKINYDTSKVYCEWKDDTLTTKSVENGVVRYHNKNLGTYSESHCKTIKKKGEDWESYHKRLQSILH